MECKNGSFVRKKILSNIIASGVEKIFIIAIQFFSTIIIIRKLPREDYGIIGIVIGYFAFVNFFNISLESSILKNHKIYDNNIKEILQIFSSFNLLKSLIIIGFAILLSVILIYIYHDVGFCFAIWSISLITVTNNMTAPFEIYFASKFEQSTVTKISIIRYLSSFILLFGLYYFPTLWYIAVKDLLVSLIYILIWNSLVFKKYNYIPKFNRLDMPFIREALLKYSIWTHLNGVVTNFIYRSDTFFLSFFVSFSIIGDYNIALSSANIANIIPMILGYQNSIALSNAKSKSEAVRITNIFLLSSIIVGLVTFFFFFFLGSFYLKIVTGSDNINEIYYLMMCIVIGLILVKSFASPLNSFINIFGSVKKLFYKVMIPSLIFTALSYFVGAYLYGAKGVAISNIFVSSFWLILMVVETKKNGYVIAKRNK